MAVFRPKLKFSRGKTYNFDVSHSSNAGHPFRFTADSGTSTYDSGVSIVGTPGNANATVSINVTADAPSLLNYYCETHGLGMGNHILVVGTVPVGRNLSDGFFSTYRLDSSDGTQITSGGGYLDAIVDQSGDIQNMSYKSYGNLDERNIFRYALNADGTFKWGKKRAPSGSQQSSAASQYKAFGKSMAVTSDNYTYSLSGTHTEPINSSHLMDAKTAEVTKWDSVGNILWTRNVYNKDAVDSAKTLTGSAYQYAIYNMSPYVIETLSNGDPIIYATEQYSDLINSQVAMVARLDKSNGDLIWARRLGDNVQDTGDNLGAGMTVDKNNNIYCTARIEYAGSTGAGQIGIEYPSIIKLDSNGNKLWTNTYGHPEGFVPEDSIGIVTAQSNYTDSVLEPEDTFTSLIADSNGDIYAAGSMKVSDANNKKGLLAKISGSDGHIVWQRHMMRTWGNAFPKMAIDNVGKIVVNFYDQAIYKYNREGKLLDEFRIFSTDGTINDNYNITPNGDNIILSGEYWDSGQSIYGGLSYNYTVSLPNHEVGKNYDRLGDDTHAAFRRTGNVFGNLRVIDVGHDQGVFPYTEYDYGDTDAKMDILTGTSGSYGPIGSLDIISGGNSTIVSTNYSGTSTEPVWTTINSRTEYASKSGEILPPLRHDWHTFNDSAIIDELYEQDTTPEYAMKMVRGGGDTVGNTYGVIAVTGENRVDIFRENDSDIFTDANRSTYTLDGTNKYVYAIDIMDGNFTSSYTGKKVIIRCGTGKESSTNTKVEVFDYNSMTQTFVKTGLPAFMPSGASQHKQDICVFEDQYDNVRFLYSNDSSDGNRVVSLVGLSGGFLYNFTDPIPHDSSESIQDVWFGYSVQADENYVCIAAPKKKNPKLSGYNSYGGAVHVWTVNNNTVGANSNSYPYKDPEYKYTIYNPGLDDLEGRTSNLSGDNFGLNMKIQGSYLAVYVQADKENSHNYGGAGGVGGVYVFRLRPQTYELVGFYSDYNAIGDNGGQYFNDDLGRTQYKSPGQDGMKFGEYSGNLSFDYPYLSMHGNEAMHLAESDFRRYNYDGNNAGSKTHDAGAIAVFDIRDNAHLGTLYHPGPYSEALNYGNRYGNSARFGNAHIIKSDGIIYAGSSTTVNGGARPGGKIRKILPNNVQDYHEYKKFRSTHSISPSAVSMLNIAGDDGTWCKGDAWTIEYWMQIDASGGSYPGYGSIFETSDNSIKMNLQSDEIRLETKDKNNSTHRSIQYGYRPSFDITGAFSEGVDSSSSTFDGDDISRWHHVAVVYHAQPQNHEGKGAVSMFIDGLNATNGWAQDGILPGTPTWSLGSSISGQNVSKIYDFAIHDYLKYNRPFADRLDFYRPEITANTKCLIVGTANGAIDLTGNGTLTTTGTVSMSTDIPNRGDIKDDLRRYQPEMWRDNSEERRNDPSARGAP